MSQQFDQYDDVQYRFGQQSPSPETFFTGSPTDPRAGARRRGAGRSGRPPGRPAGRGGSGGGGGRGGRRFIDLPRYGRQGFTRWIPSWKLVSGLFSLGVVLLLAAMVAAYALIPIPAKQADPLPQASFVYYSDGTQIGQFKQEQRTVVSIDDVPEYVQNAVLSAEDRTFYENRGISPTGIIRAAWADVRGEQLQGGSTITQQYVKNFFLTQDRTVTRKVKEFVISLKVTQNTRKKDILEDYLNKIYFGRNAYGIKAAAKAYFNVDDLKKLTISQGAFLAGIINGPELYDPADNIPSHTAAATERWQYVLDGMVSQSWLSAADEQKILAARLPPVVKPTKPVGRVDQRGYLMDMVEAEALAKYGIKRSALDKDGYQIRTTFNHDLIESGITAISDVLGPRAKWPSGVQVGMTSIDPTSGAVLAIYGGDDDRYQNSATQDIAPAGSTFKAFALIAALSGSEKALSDRPALSLRSRYDTASFKVGSTPVRNFSAGENGMGPVDLMTMTAESINTAYARLNQDVGPKNTMKAAIAAGLPSGCASRKKGDTSPCTQDLDATDLNVLGSAAPHVIDMASAYGTIANLGKHVEPFVIKSIVKPQDNNYDYFTAPKSAQVFDQGVMQDVTYAMQQVVKRGTGTYVQRLGRPAAGKTGTSSDNKSAWFVGFTPQVSTAFALYKIGADNTQAQLDKGWTGSVKGREITGGTYPAQLWTAYMKAALKGVAVKALPDPIFGGEVVNPAPSPTPTPTDSPTPSNAGPSDQPQPSVPPSDQPQPSGQSSAPPTGAPQPSASVPGNGQPSTAVSVG